MLTESSRYSQWLEEQWSVLVGFSVPVLIDVCLDPGMTCGGGNKDSEQWRYGEGGGGEGEIRIVSSGGMEREEVEREREVVSGGEGGGGEGGGGEGE